MVKCVSATLEFGAALRSDQQVAASSLTGHDLRTGGMAEIYRDPVADRGRLELVVRDIDEATGRGRTCLVLRGR